MRGAACVIPAPPFADSAAPALTADPKDDPILYTAFVADVDLLISSDKHLPPTGKKSSGKTMPGRSWHDQSVSAEPAPVAFHGWRPRRPGTS